MCIQKETKHYNEELQLVPVFPSQYGPHNGPALRSNRRLRRYLEISSPKSIRRSPVDSIGVQVTEGSFSVGKWPP